MKDTWGPPSKGWPEFGNRPKPVTRNLPIHVNGDYEKVIGYINTESIDPELLDHAELFLTKINNEILAIGVYIPPAKEAVYEKT